MAHVLIVEDEPDIAEAFKGYLDLLGHTCDVADDGRQALNLVLQAEFEYDLILCDLHLPRVAGGEFLERVYGLVRWRTPLVVISAWPHLIEALGELRRGAFSIVQKPIDKAEFDEMVARALDQRAAYARIISLEHRNTELQRRLDVLVRENEDLYNQARVDVLTELPNRRRLLEDLRVLGANWQRYETPYALVLCDVDDFGRYNKSHSLEAGDRALKLVAQTIREACRGGDTLYRFGGGWGESAYRFGGDEFVLVLPAQSLTEAVQAVERVRLKVASVGADDENGVPGPPVTISAGVVVPGDAKDRSTKKLLAEANELLRQAKEEGGNCVRPALLIPADSDPLPGD